MTNFYQHNGTSYVHVSDYAALEAEIERLRRCRDELKDCTNAIQDPRVNLTITLEDAINELRARVVMAEDAAQKGDLARANAGGMEMEIAELREQLRLCNVDQANTEADLAEAKEWERAARSET